MSQIIRRALERNHGRIFIVKVYLADLVHNVRAGGNVLTGSQDYTIPLNIGHIGAYVKQVYGDQVDLRLFKYATDLLGALESEPPTVLGFSHYAWNSDLNSQIGRYFAYCQDKPVR